MRSIIDLRNELLQLFDDIKAGGIEVKQASEMNNTAGKIMNSVKTQLQYAELREEKPDIEFLNK